MNVFRAFLAISTVAIYSITVIAIINNGVNWPAVALGDLLKLGWRAQFDTDFIIYLAVFASWIVWREGQSAKAYAFGLLSIVMGGMFSFPYILYATFTAHGDMKALLLGVHRE